MTAQEIIAQKRQLIKTRDAICKASYDCEGSKFDRLETAIESIDKALEALDGVLLTYSTKRFK